VSESKSVNVSLLGGPFFILFIVLLILKLVPKNDAVLENLSWWWVTAPIWGPWAAVLAILVVAGVLYLVGDGLERLHVGNKRAAANRRMRKSSRKAKRALDAYSKELGDRK
jgi:hypothetical protein